MEVTPDNKEAQASLIPKDWEYKSLFEIAMRKRELFNDGDWIESEHITNDGIRLIQTGNIGIGRFVEQENKKYINEASFLELRCKELKKGDLLICRLADPAGRACILGDIDEERVVTSVDVTIFRPPEDFADRRYLLHVFSAAGWFKAVSDRSGGTTHKRIARGALGQLAVNLPPISEQRAIADALSDVDTLMNSLDRLIAKKRDLKQAAMQQLLTGQTRLPGFSGEWEVKRLGDVLKICHGRSQREVETVDGPYPILATGGQIGRASRPLCDRPSVLIGRKGTINKPQYMDTPFWTVDTLFYSEIKDSHSARFIFYLFCTIDWLQYNEASGVPSLNARTIENIEVHLPEPIEQTAIATALTKMDTELSVLEQRRNKSAALKQGMMQELLTGRTRLV